MDSTLNIENHDELHAYLGRHGHITAAEQVAIHTLAGGVSNRTVLVERATGGALVVKQALTKLRVAVDWFSSPARIHREAAGMRALAQILPAGAVPSLIFEDDEHHLLGMEAVPQPHTNWKSMLLAGELHLRHFEQFGEVLALIHSRSYCAPETFAAQFSDRSFFETLRLEPYYLYTAGQHPAAADFYHDLVAETRAESLALTHGDYSPKNILIYQDRLVLLDHEVIHWGDPAFDIGFAFTHLLSKAHYLAPQREQLLNATRHCWQSYVQAAGSFGARAGYEARAVRHTLACLLARVDGRSPLEYLTHAHRERQRRVVLALIAEPPASMSLLFTTFAERLADYARH